MWSLKESLSEDGFEVLAAFVEDSSSLLALCVNSKNWSRALKPDELTGPCSERVLDTVE